MKPNKYATTKMDLIAGPWVGEFGWELFGWQGVIRDMSERYNRTIIYGRPGHQFLYEDFMDEYVEFVPQGTEPNMWLNEGTKFELPGHHKNACWIKPQQFAFMPNAPHQNIIRYGVETDRTMIAYHARNLTKYGSGYMNWSSWNWKKLMERYARVVCIGSKKGADYIGGEDLRGAPINETCDALSRCSVLIGPSSGAIHLGSLCGTPHVVWSGHYKNKARYEQWWNPLKTPVRTICPEDSPWDKKIMWQPEPGEIATKVEELLCAA